MCRPSDHGSWFAPTWDRGRNPEVPHPPEYGGAMHIESVRDLPDFPLVLFKKLNQLGTLPFGYIGSRGASRMIERLFDEVAPNDRSSVVQQRAAFDDLFQLTDIVRPIMFPECFDGTSTQVKADRAVIADAAQEMPCEHRDIVTALA